MGSLISKVKEEEVETPGKDSVLKRIEDPRSPTEEINRTPIEVPDKVPKYNDIVRQLAYSNALKQQNSNICEFSPLCRNQEKSNKDLKKPKYPFSAALDTAPILLADESVISLDVSTTEKENVS